MQRDLFIRDRKRQGKQVPIKLPSKKIMKAVKQSDTFNRPFFIQIAAMNYVSGQDIDEKTMEPLLTEACNLEFQTWIDLIGRERCDQDENIEEAIDRGVCQATLVCGTENSEETHALMLSDNRLRDRMYAHLDVLKVERFLKLFLAGENNGLAPLQPDILGEHFVASHLKEIGNRDLLSACLVWSGEKSSLRRTDVLRVINKSSQKEHGTVGISTANIIRRLVQSLSFPEPEYGYSTKDEMAMELVEVAISSQGALEQILSEECGLPRSVFSSLRHISHELENGEEELKIQKKEVALILGEVCARKLEGINVDTSEGKSAVSFGRLAVFLLKNKYQNSGELAVEAALSIAEGVVEEGSIIVHGKVTHDIVQVLCELGRFDMAEILAKRCHDLLDQAREQQVRNAENVRKSTGSFPLESAKSATDVVVRMLLMSDRANVAQLRGQSGEAVAYRLEAAEVAETTSAIIGNQAPEFILASEIDLSMALAKNKQAEEAKKLAERSIASIERFPHAIDRSTALNTLSAVHSLSGNFKAALVASDRALKEVSTVSDNPETHKIELAQARLRARRSFSIDLWNDGQQEAAKEAEKKADDDDSLLRDHREANEKKRQQRAQQLYEERVRFASTFAPKPSRSDHVELPRIEPHSPLPEPVSVSVSEPIDKYLPSDPQAVSSRRVITGRGFHVYKSDIPRSITVHAVEKLPTEVIKRLSRDAVRAKLSSEPPDTPVYKITWGVDGHKLAFYLTGSSSDTFPRGKYEITYSLHY